MSFLAVTLGALRFQSRFFFLEGGTDFKNGLAFLH